MGVLCGRIVSAVVGCAVRSFCNLLITIILYTICLGLSTYFLNIFICFVTCIKQNSVLCAFLIGVYFKRIPPGGTAAGGEGRGKP